MAKTGRSIYSTEKFNHLLEQLKDKSAAVRICALESLANDHHPTAFDEIVKALSDKNPNVRVTAVESLGTSKNKEGVSYLIAKLIDPNSEVRMRAAEGLGRLLKGDSSPAALIKRLQDNDELVRIAAAGSLGTIGDTKALPSLRKAIRDRSPLVRSYVAEAIGKLGDKRDIKKLERELEQEKSELSKVGIYQALYLLGQHHYLQDLLVLLQSKDYRVRCATANTLPELYYSASTAQLILSILRKALRQEKTVAARSSIRSSLRIISQLNSNGNAS